MRESRTYGSVRGALSNERPYRDRRFAKKKQTGKALIFVSFFSGFQAVLAIGCKVTSKPSLAIWLTSRLTLVSGARLSKYPEPRSR